MYVSSNFSIYVVFSNLLTCNCLWYSFNIVFIFVGLVVISSLSFQISVTFSYFYLPSFCNSQSTLMFVNFVALPKELTLVSFLLLFFYFISFIFILIFIIFFLLLALGLVCYFSSSLRYKVRLLICHLSSLIM